MNDTEFIATFSVNSWLHARFKNINQSWEQRWVKLGLVSVRMCSFFEHLYALSGYPATYSGSLFGEYKLHFRTLRLVYLAVLERSCKKSYMYNVGRDRRDECQKLVAARSF